MRSRFAGGLFTAGLRDPGVTRPLAPSLFAGTAPWLRIWFSPDNTNFTRLRPDQLLAQAPYAAFANSASNLLGQVTAAQLPVVAVTNGAAGLALGGSFSGDGSGLTNLNASWLATGTVPPRVLAGFQAPYYAVVGGGFGNSAGYLAVAGLGNGNTASGYYATVPGGNNNQAAGQNSFAASQRAKALHDGTFVWADAQAADFASLASNQFLIRAKGGVGIGTSATAANALTVDDNVAATSVSGDGAVVSNVSGMMLWQIVTGTKLQAQPGQGYLALNAGATVITLPTALSSSPPLPKALSTHLPTPASHGHRTRATESGRRSPPQPMAPNSSRSPDRPCPGNVAPRRRRSRSTTGCHIWLASLDRSGGRPASASMTVRIPLQALARL